MHELAFTSYFDEFFREGTFETLYGLASESLKSPLYRGGWCQGSVVTPVHIIFPLAFEALGRMDLAKRAAKKYCDLLKAGVVDPAKVVRCALQNAASIAGLLLTTDCMVTDIPEKKECGCGQGGGQPGMDGML